MLDIKQQVLASGGRVVATARDKSRLANLVKGNEDRALALQLDVTDTGQIAAAVAEAQARFGRIDVLVNNAGYGYQAAVEEGEEQEIRARFDANVFGLFALTRAVLPSMRARGSGHVVGGRLARLAGIGLLRSKQACGGGLVRCLESRGRTTGHQGHLRGARSVSYRLCRALAAPDAEPDRCVCGHGGRAPERDHPHERHPAG